MHFGVAAFPDTDALKHRTPVYFGGLRYFWLPLTPVLTLNAQTHERQSYQRQSCFTGIITVLYLNSIILK